MEQDQDRRGDALSADVSVGNPYPEDAGFMKSDFPINQLPLQETEEQISDPLTLESTAIPREAAYEASSQSNMEAFSDSYERSGSAYGQSYDIPPNPYTQGNPHVQQNPYGQYNPYYQQNPYAQTYRYSRVPVLTQQESKKGVVAVICGILSMALSYYIAAISFPLGIIAIVLGISKIKEANKIGSGKVSGVLGLIFGILGTVATVGLTTWLLIRFFRAMEGLSQLGEHRPM